jgi:adenylosuccinate synthase
MAEKGGEFGTTTGRARRCGWLDLVVVGYSATLSGFTGIAMTKIDVLSGFEELRVCTHYVLDGKKVSRMPADLRLLERCEPRYTKMPGWPEIDEASMKRILSKGYRELPADMKRYVKFVEERLRVPVVLLGLGRRRNEILDLRKRKSKKRGK